MIQEPTENLPAATEAPVLGMTRATFVKALGGVLLGGAVLPLNTAAASANAVTHLGPLRTLDHASLAPRVGQAFRIYHDGTSSVVVLTQVSDVLRQELGAGANPKFNAAESFDAVFRAAGRLELRQGTYPIRHQGPKRLSIFLVPSVGVDGRQRYIAVFNRLTK